MSVPAYQLDGRGASREAFYAAACDPRRHVVVEACAGAGKTWMLVARIVRALLGGALPHEILAITFTRKAAGEMRARLALWLREFAELSARAAAARLVAFGVAPHAAAEQAPLLIGLHERVLESGRGVEVRTMHAWYMQLLGAAPIDLLVDLGLAPGMTPIEDIDELKPALMHAFHRALLADADLLAAYRRLSLRHGRSMLGRWFDAALERRAEIELADAAGVLESSVEPASEPAPAARVRDAALVRAAQSLARALTQRAQYRTKCETAARRLIDGLALADDREAYDALRAALFTTQGTPRKQLGDLAEQAALCAELDAIGEQLVQQEAHDDHQSMTGLTRVLFAHYAALKRRRGLVDMADLERVALSLLAEHELSGWVQQRLDARVRHLLIDEFQDTSPLQWHALQSWLAAYAGAGGGIEAPRVFIVGDPKQSIYRFRRAEPRVFVAAQHFVVEALGGTLAACDHTRRCAPGVVSAVNQVFSAWSGAGGLPDWRDHTTQVAPGAEAWPALMRLASAERPPRAAGRNADEADERVWRPSLTVPRIAAEVVLREAEAAAVAQAIEQMIHVKGVAPGEIFVLARRRAVLQGAAEALAARHLPHVAPEKLLLADLPEVQDLLALIDVLASPGQSLSLARALRSPLFGASDAELLELARRAREAGGWWPALMACAQDARAATALHRAATLCAAWSIAAEHLPPHDLLDRIVHEGDLLPRLAAAAPPERRARALDAVRALLAAALELDGGRYASPYGFVRALRSRKVQAPPSPSDAAVQLLTVHGAKGLEARVVFLMDCDPQPPKAQTATLLVDWPVDAARPRCVAFVAAQARCPASLQALMAEELAAREREEANALYVALTRAEQRIVASRTPPLHDSAARSWWARLESLALPWVPMDLAAPSHDESWADVVALPLHARPHQGAAPAASADDEPAARLGQAVHRTLEWVGAAPGAPPDVAALARAAALAFAVPDAAPVAAIVERILASPDCRRFFDPAQVAWAGNEVPIGSVDGQPRRLDRLVRFDAPERCWWVLDYKLHPAPQRSPVLLEQLAAYRHAVAAVVPGEAVRAAFITAEGALIEPAT